MDTQPLLRVNSIKPQTSQSVAAHNNDSAGFDQHLQDQMQQADAGKNSANSPAQRNTETSAQQTQATGSEQETARQLDENTEADDLDVTTVMASEAGVVVMADAMLVNNLQQDLPADGNILPLAIADLLNQQNSSPGTNGAAMIVANAAVVDESVQASQQLNEQDMMPLAGAESVTAALNDQLVDENALLENTKLPVQLSVKAADVMNDKQFAALMQEANKTSAVVMQQVAGVSGSVAANVQTYVPPQFDAMPGLSGGINTPVNHPAWGNQVGEQLAFMIHGKIHSAEIKLNPAHLGPMEIHVSLNDDQASVSFVSAHAPVREALDAALPRLRDMLEQQGLNLVNVDVSAHSGSRHETFGQADNPAHNSALSEQADATAASGTVAVNHIETGLSVFA